MKGFTLVELVTVATILAVLAATAIPAYNGYIIRTSDQVCEHTAAAVLTSIVSFIQVKGDINSGSYDIDGINSLLKEYKISIPKGYEAEIIIIDKDDITVIVQDDQYLGTATLGT